MKVNHSRMFVIHSGSHYFKDIKMADILNMEKPTVYLLHQLHKFGCYNSFYIIKWPINDER